MKTITIFFLLIFSINSFAHSCKDSTECDDKWNFEKEFKNRFSFVDSYDNPLVSIQYGMVKSELKGLSSSFSDSYLGNLRLGYHQQKESFEIPSFRQKYFNIQYIKNNIEEAGKLSAEQWQVGFGWDKGLGYDFGRGVSLMLYNGYGMDWTYLSYQGNPLTADSLILERINKSIRFGTNASAGLKLFITNNISIEGGYTRSIIFERHLFWKSAGSALLETIAHGLLDEFIDEIKSSSKIGAPIVNFILKSGLSYAFYELRKEKMNWPFDSASPLMNDKINFGITFVF